MDSRQQDYRYSILAHILMYALDTLGYRLVNRAATRSRVMVSRQYGTTHYLILMGD